MTSEVPRPELSKQAIINRIDAYNLLESTRGWMTEQARNGHRISFPLAIATRIYLDKREQLSRFNFREKQGMALVYANLLNQAGQEAASDFVKMAGGAILKSILVSLERGAVDGWNDDIFIQELNFNIEDTPIVQFKSNSSDKSEYFEDQFVRLNRETLHMRKTLVRDKTFLGFFQQDKVGRYRKLPESMRTFFDENHVWKTVLDSTLPIFREASILQAKK